MQINLQVAEKRVVRQWRNRRERPPGASCSCTSCCPTEFLRHGAGGRRRASGRSCHRGRYPQPGCACESRGSDFQGRDPRWLASIVRGEYVTVPHPTKRTVNENGDETTQELHFFYDAQSRPAFVEYDGVMYRYIHNLRGDIVAIVNGDETPGNSISSTIRSPGRPLLNTTEPCTATSTTFGATSWPSLTLPESCGRIQVRCVGQAFVRHRRHGNDPRRAQSVQISRIYLR